MRIWGRNGSQEEHDPINAVVAHHRVAAEAKAAAAVGDDVPVTRMYDRLQPVRWNQSKMAKRIHCKRAVGCSNYIPTATGSFAVRRTIMTECVLIRSSLAR